MPAARVALQIMKRINAIYREETDLLAEIKTLIQAHCPALLDQHGCGTVTATIIIGHTAAAKRLPTDACFARHAGVAPIRPALGTPNATDCTGDGRQLNRALHIIAFSGARATPPPMPTWPANTPNAKPKPKRSAASNAQSPATSGTCSTQTVEN